MLHVQVAFCANPIKAINGIIEKCKFVFQWTPIDLSKVYPNEKGKLRNNAGISIIDVRHAALLKMRLTKLREDIRVGNVDFRSYLAEGQECSEAEAHRQKVLEARYIGSSSICAEIEAYKIAQMVWPEASVFLDIGANRGFISALFFSLWGGGGYEFTPYTLNNLFEKENFFPHHMNPAGVCKTGLNRAYPLYCPPSFREADGKCTVKNPNFKLYSVDASSFLVRSLRKVLGYFSNSNLEQYWNIFQLAVTNEDGVVDFELQNEQLKPGFEAGRIVLPKEKSITSIETEEVQMVSLKTFATENNLAKIDVIKIDVEGYDLEAVIGAMDILDSSKVGLLTFEKTLSKVKLLHEVLKDLEAKKYDCYTPHFFGLIKLTGKCYTAKGTPAVGNVFCASRKFSPALVVSFDALSLYHLDGYYAQYEKYQRDESIASSIKL